MGNYNLMSNHNPAEEPTHGRNILYNAGEELTENHHGAVSNLSEIHREKVRIGKMCRDYRMTIGYSQGDVARDCNVTRACVSRFESEGRANWTVLMWYITHGLDLSVSMSENRCVCCSDLIPEGVQVCPRCEKTLGIAESIEGL